MAKLRGGGLCSWRAVTKDFIKLQQTFFLGLIHTPLFLLYYFLNPSGITNCQGIPLSWGL